jgi:hypothetical protein
MTDADAKVMKHKDGRSLPSYNNQSAAGYNRMLWVDKE